MQLGDAAAAVLYNNTSYLTTNAVASPPVSWETGKDTNLLAPFAICRCELPARAMRRSRGQRFSLEAERCHFRAAEQPSSS